MRMRPEILRAFDADRPVAERGALGGAADDADMKGLGRAAGRHSGSPALRMPSTMCSRLARD